MRGCRYHKDLRRLIIRPGAIGDCILATPSIEFLCRNAGAEVWAPTAVLPLIHHADRVRSLASTGLDLLGIPGVETPPALLATLREFDSIVSWYGANHAEFRAEVASLNLPFEFLRALPDRQDQGHCADFFARQVGAPLPSIPHLDVGAVKPADYAVIHPFSGSRRKNWPLSRYRELAARLPMRVQWCAGPEEVLADGVRFDNLLKLGRWLAASRVYIGNDSGITHLAAAAGARVVAIFGPTDPEVWGPRGTRVQIVRGQLEEISTDTVYDAICTLL